MKKSFNAVENYAANPSPEAMETVQQMISAAYSKIDKAVKRRVLHRNNGARQKSRLAKALKKVTAAS